MDGLWKLSFLSWGYLLVLAVLPGCAKWIGSAAGIAVARQIGYPDKVQGAKGSETKACIAEIRWGRGVEIRRLLMG